MTGYITLAIVFFGMLGSGAIVMYWERKDREQKRRQERDDRR